MAIKRLSYCYCAHFGVYRGQTVSRVPSLQSQWESDAENASGGRRESTVAIRTRYLSLDFFPVVNAPFWGPHSVCSSTSKTGPPSLKGKIGKEVAETQCGLYHLRTPACHWQLRNTTTYIRCHTALKTNSKNDSRHTVGIWTQGSKLCLNKLTLKAYTHFPM